MRPQRLLDRHHRDAGASAIEFALLLPVLVLFVFGIIEFGFAYSRMQGIQAAAHEGGRVAAIGLDPSDVEARVVEAAPPLIFDPTTDLEVTVDDGSGGDYCRSNDADETVHVTVSATDPGQYAIRVPLLPDIEQTFEAEAVFRCERLR